MGPEAKRVTTNIAQEKAKRQSMTAVIVLNAVFCVLVVVVIDGLLLWAISAEAKDHRAHRGLPAPKGPRISVVGSRIDPTRTRVPESDGVR